MITYWLRPYILRLSVSLVLYICAQNILAQAQDTIPLSLPQAEKRFLDSNLSLLAAQYNIDVQKAFTRQAHLWNNPTLNTDQVIAGDGNFFPYGKKVNGISGGQYFIQIQQLITTARKRGKLIALSETNEKISELQLQNILLNLKDVLYNDYYSLVQLSSIAQLYRRQNTQLDVLYNGMNAQFNAGNIALKDLLRIQALSVSLKQDMAENAKAIEKYTK